jgi:hypothetical protein
MGCVDLWWVDISCCVGMGVCLELYAARQKRFAELLDARNYEELTRVFPRSESAWLQRLANENATDEVLMEAIEHCRKSWKIWSFVLEHIVQGKHQLGDDDVAELLEECVEAVGRDFDSGDVLPKLQELLKAREIELPKEATQVLSTVINKHFPKSHSRDESSLERSQSDRKIFEVKQKFDPMLFPAKSSFTLDTEIANECLHALASRPEDQESLLQLLVFAYNDDPASWVLYCDWLAASGRSEDAQTVIEKAANQYVNYNPNMKVLAGSRLGGIDVSGAEVWYWKALQSGDVGLIDCAGLEKIASLVPASRWHTLIPPNTSQRRFAEYLVWKETSDVQALLNLAADTRQSNIEVVLSEGDLMLYCLALDKLGAAVEAEDMRMLKQHGKEILQWLPETHRMHAVIDSLLEKDKSVPRPVSRAPPPPVRNTQTQHNAKRPLPGYTPGWLASEYAKKHNI